MNQGFLGNIGRHKKHIGKCIHMTGQIFDGFNDLLSRQTTLPLKSNDFVRQTGHMVATIVVGSTKTILTLLISPAGCGKVGGNFLGKIFNLTAGHRFLDLPECMRKKNEAPITF